MGFSYAGYHSAADKHGIRGYIQQLDSATVARDTAIFSWIGLCAYGCSEHSFSNGGSGYQFVQVGMYQGYSAAGNSPSVVSQYYENVNPCNQYFKDDLTPPDQNRQFYSLKWNGNSAGSFQCPDGTAYSGYRFEFKKGQPTNDPFFVGRMGINDGEAAAMTERHGTPIMDKAFFGCYSPGSCNNQSYGLNLTNDAGTGWVLWQGFAHSIEDNPPYRHTYNTYWSFRTCHTAADC